MQILPSININPPLAAIHSTSQPATNLLSLPIKHKSPGDLAPHSDF